jgi:hypothetical protein
MSLSWASNKDEILEKIILEEAAEARAKRPELLENAIKTEGAADFALATTHARRSRKIEKWTPTARY